MYMTNLLLAFSEDHRKLQKHPCEKGVGAGQEEGDSDDDKGEGKEK